MSFRTEHLENLNNINKSRHSSINFLKEIKVFILIFALVFVGMLVFTNIDLFATSLSDTFNLSKKLEINKLDKKDLKQDSSISTILENNTIQDKKIQNLIDQQKNTLNTTKIIATPIESELNSKLKNYTFDFNILPPTNRIIIPSIGIDIPIVNSQLKDVKDFTIGNFNSELMNGVVKYPSTPDPGKGGNTLIFGHTSQERWQKNPYGTIFSKIPQLINGDIIQIIREGNLYEYRVIKQEIVTPSKVNSKYLEYNEKGNYVTLMGCYPLGRTDKRMMVIAEQV